MPLQLALLRGTARDGRRPVTFPGGTRELGVSGRAASLAPDTLALLETDADDGHVRDAMALPRSPWPKNLPSAAALPPESTPLRRVLAASLSSHGSWCVDEDGFPCEIGRVGHQHPTYVLNYSGWQLFDIQRLDVEMDSLQVGPVQVLLITPDAVPRSRLLKPAAAAKVPPSAPTLRPTVVAPPAPSFARPVTPRPRSGPVWPGSAFNRPEVRAPAGTPAPIQPVTPREPAAPARALGTHSIAPRLSDITFLDGAVSFESHGLRFEFATPLSSAVFEPIKEVVEKDVPRVEATIHIGPSEHHVRAMPGLEALRRVFKRVELERWEARVFAVTEVQDLATVLASMPVEGVRDRFETLCELSSFGMSARAEALRRLYAIRVTAELTGILPGKALLLPIAGKDGGRPWLVWETFDNDRATYVFRPPDDTTAALLRSWLSAGGQRGVLRADVTLQERLAYRGRAIHLGDDWWGRLMSLMDRPS